MQKHLLRGQQVLSRQNQPILLSCCLLCPRTKELVHRLQHWQRLYHPYCSEHSGQSECVHERSANRKTLKLFKFNYRFEFEWRSFEDGDCVIFTSTYQSEWSCWFEINATHWPWLTSQVSVASSSIKQKDVAKPARTLWIRLGCIHILTFLWLLRPQQFAYSLNPKQRHEWVHRLQDILPSVCASIEWCPKFEFFQIDPQKRYRN